MFDIREEWVISKIPWNMEESPEQAKTDGNQDKAFSRSRVSRSHNSSARRIDSLSIIHRRTSDRPDTGSTTDANEKRN